MVLNFAKNRHLKEFSTIGIGGPIKYFAKVQTLADMQEGILFAKQRMLPFLVIGKGSNCLFDDRGFSGVVLLNKIDYCHFTENLIDVGAGYSFSLLGVHASKRNLTGLEFASAIPATVGGAVYMNAGANGFETATYIESVDFIDRQAKLQTFTKERLSFGYRSSSFQNMQGAIISVRFRLPQSTESARKKQLEIIHYRKKTQPLQEKSIGCIFCNPSQEISAGYAIEKCGLKGFRIGGAAISEKHANFILNEGKSSAEDVKRLIQEVQKQVKEQMGISLIEEIRQIPYE